ncbi:MAG: amidophosphoribosyltransferase [Defluviitaleaceae bacterium]|nr:amidophosphoribosyltransferase [Defluviitaleaceae bacterium]
MPKDIRGLNEACGVFGVWGHKDSAEMAYYGLHALQHRGQDGAGMVVKNENRLIRHRGPGLASEAFPKETLDKLAGTAVIGHVRYVMTGTHSEDGYQPRLFHFEKSSMAICHNGSLVNAGELRHDLESDGSIFQTTSDSETLAHLIRKSRHSFLLDKLKAALRKIRGSFTFLLLTQKKMIAARDPHGIRPLVIGKLGDAYMVASETCAFDALGATYVRDVAPGEIVIIDNDGLRSEFYNTDTSLAVCSMEYIYFARPDSDIDGVNVHTSRKNAGRILAEESPTPQAEVVVPSPDSGISAAIGYAEASGTPYEIGLIKNRYAMRTFIAPSQELREQGVKMKLSAVRAIVEGKSVVLVEDSIVRGTTSKRIVTLLKEAGAREVHMKVASPILPHSCCYGIDLHTAQELIAYNNTKDDICRIIGADSLSYLSEEGLIKAIGIKCGKGSGLCLACFNGHYPAGS